MRIGLELFYNKSYLHHHFKRNTHGALEKLFFCIFIYLTSVSVDKTN